MSKSVTTQQYSEHERLLSEVTMLRARGPGDRLGRLSSAIERALAHSPYYRSAPGWRPVRHMDELADLPFTRRQDVQDAYPFGFLATGRERLVRYAESTGTSGRPCASYATRRDWLINNLDVSLSWAGLLTSSDVLAVAVPYELTYVGADIDRVAELLGVPVISVGVNNNLCSWPRVIELMRSYSVTALFCSPTRAIRLSYIAEEAGLDPLRDLEVKKIICVGETSSKAKRECIARRWGASVYNHYGMTEVMAVAVPCPEGGLHLCEGRLFVEVIDPETLAPARAGAPGELVITSLTSEAMPLLRYRTGDLVLLDTPPCPCGNPQRSIQQLGRVSDAFETPSGVAYFHELDEELLNVPEVQPYYHVSRGERGLSVSIALKGGRREGQGRPGHAVVESLRERLARRFGVDVAISLEEEGSWLHRIDSRSKPGSALGIPPETGGVETGEREPRAGSVQ